MRSDIQWPRPSTLWLLGALLLCIAVYLPGLQGGWFFDDYANIVDNTDVQPARLDAESVARAALSSPASQLKRPLASLSFVANYLAGGLDPFGWKAVNLLIHLLNGWLVWLLARRLLAVADSTTCEETSRRTAALIAGAWLLLPINLTAVLYVVQRMESLANLFVLGGLLLYTLGRQCQWQGNDRRGLLYCLVALTAFPLLGVLAKESAAPIPLFALLLELCLFRFRRPGEQKRDRRLVTLFALLLIPALVAASLWLLPWVLRPATWASRDFTLATRLLSEARILLDYIGWTLLPAPRALSFYHDNFQISASLFSPWTTLASICAIAALLVFAVWLRRRAALAALGIALYFAGHLLTGTVLPLELIYEHRNYFPSFGLLLAVIPPLAAAPRQLPAHGARWIALGLLATWWAALTALTAHAWGDPLRQAREIDARAQDSARARFELGRQLLLRANYAPGHPLTREAYVVLQQAAALPRASVLPEQSLIVTSAVNQEPVADAWWQSMESKLRAYPPDVQDIAALGALERCVRGGACVLPFDRLKAVFDAALAHPTQSGDLLMIHADFAWNVSQEWDLAERSAAAAVAAAPGEPSYRITLIRIQISYGRRVQAEAGIAELARLNVRGSLDRELAELRALLEQHVPVAPAAPST